MGLQKFGLTFEQNILLSLMSNIKTNCIGLLKKYVQIRQYNNIKTKCKRFLKVYVQFNKIKCSSKSPWISTVRTIIPSVYCTLHNGRELCGRSVDFILVF